jgi:hypothetical protein
MQIELEWKADKYCEQLCYGYYVFGEVAFTGSNTYTAIVLGGPMGSIYLGESFFLEEAKEFVETYLKSLLFT